MTSWKPELEDESGGLYLALARAIDRDVRSGRLPVGTRMPTHRDLADELGVAVGTVTRAYAEAERRGLVRGEVGRGTFVRDPSAPPTELRTGEARSGFIDLGLNYPLYSEEPDLRESLARMARRSDLSELLHYHASEGMPRHRAAGAEWARRCGMPADPDDVLVCSGAQHALTITLATVLKPGDLLLTEELAYPGLKGIAALLGVRLAAVALDGEGIVPAALDAACRRRKARALYCTPTLQNPTGALMSAKRRKEIAKLAEKHDLFVLEDDVHRRFVADPPPPIASFVPDRGFFVAATSKALAGGLRVAYLVAPRGHTGRLAQALWATTWMVPPLNAEIVATWIEDGTAERIVERKRAETEARQRIAAERFPDVRPAPHPNALYMWMPLPEPWTSAQLTASARRAGVGVTPSELFCVGDA
ncbi:MAG: PLP-dependent aminotransferase family protein, partial [bacterium]